MNFNTDITKQAHEVTFSHKSIKTNHSSAFNDIPVARTDYQKHFGLHLDNKLNFNQQIKEKMCKANKSIDIIRKFNNTLQEPHLLPFTSPLLGLTLTTVI